MIKKIFTLLALTTCFVGRTLADSPITDTPFSNAYADVAIVQKAAGSNGLLTPELIAFLLDAKQPVDVKLAVINALGTVYDGKQNANLFYDALIKKRKLKSEDDVLMRGTNDDLICMAYLAATDNYFDMAWALTYVYSLEERTENRYSVRLVSSLIVAQRWMKDDWCRTWHVTNAVRVNEELTHDLRPAAEVIVFEYMDLFEEACMGDGTLDPGDEGYDAYEDGEYDGEGDVATEDETYYSPLTSTTFGDVYDDEPIMARAIEANGMLTNELMTFLLSDKQPLDLKMAVINRLGWWVEGNTNAETFLAFILKKGTYKSEGEFLSKGKTEDILCLAYLKAMDHYDNVEDVIPLVDVVVKREPKSYTAQLISAVIVSQQLSSEDWCAVYLLCNEVKVDEALKFDMRQEAADRIYAYMDLYLQGCEEQGGE